jgi:hypothetical protein
MAHACSRLSRSHCGRQLLLLRGDRQAFLCSGQWSFWQAAVQYCSSSIRWDGVQYLGVERGEVLTTTTLHRPQALLPPLAQTLTQASNSRKLAESLVLPPLQIGCTGSRCGVRCGKCCGLRDQAISVYSAGYPRLASQSRCATGTALAQDCCAEVRPNHSSPRFLKQLKTILPTVLDTSSQMVCIPFLRVGTRQTRSLDTMADYLLPAPSSLVFATGPYKGVSGH